MCFKLFSFCLSSRTKLFRGNWRPMTHTLTIALERKESSWLRTKRRTLTSASWPSRFCSALTRRVVVQCLFLGLLNCFPVLSAIAKDLYLHPVAGTVLAPTYGPAVQLFCDQAFNNGFRAFWSCSDFDGDNSLTLGNCLTYYTPYANRYTTPQGQTYAVHSWPDTGSPSDYNKYWDFNEGIHENFTTPYGYTFPFDSQGNFTLANDLAVHRLEANQATTAQGISGGLYGLTATQIFLQSMNNLSSADPNFNSLVRTVVSNRSGTLMTYMNTRNEIRNVATYNGAQFAYDTWPHFHIEQNFKQLIDLATLSQVNLSVNVQIWPVNMMPNTIPGNTFSAAGWGLNFTLRRKDNPDIVVFLGYTPYSVWSTTNSPPDYEEYFGGDQFDQALYRGNPNDLGGPIASNGSVRTITIELRELMNKAIAKAGGNLGPYVLDDYYLAAVGFGWETMGYEEVTSQISAVSLYGLPKTVFDAEVYQDSAYDSFNGDLPWTGDGAPGLRRAHWAEWGVNEGRVASSTFDVKIYVQRWGSTMPQCFRSDGTPDYACAISHYVFYGRDAGHPGHW
jgi:hypothetical protein